jgi:hypothetical protein
MAQTTRLLRFGRTRREFQIGLMADFTPPQIGAQRLGETLGLCCIGFLVHDHHLPKRKGSSKSLDFERCPAHSAAHFSAAVAQW